jgi:uncharacterized membrane protein YsdA (DUF1294 family)
MTLFLICWYSILNTAAFFAYGLDKFKAIHNRWRIPEKILLGLAVLGGAPGAFAGSRVFHHKTSRKKIYFTVTNLISLAAHTGILLYFYLS